MSKEIHFSNFLKKVEKYENVHAVWCAKLVAHGRRTIQSVCNNIDNKQLTNLTDSFMKFVSLLAQSNPSTLSNEKHSFKSSEDFLEQQNESQDLFHKNDIIKMVNNDLQCPICNEWLFRATSANCNHTFCKICIQKWLKINDTCPVCRSSIHYTSTSLAVDNFISNLSQLIGGFIKERRESVQNAQLDHTENQSNVSGNELINSLNVSESLVDDTFVSQLEITTPMTHPNMVRLIPQQFRTPEVGLNVRSSAVSLNQGPGIPHHNVVELLPFPTSTDNSSRGNLIQPTPSTSVVSPHHSRFKPTTSASVVNTRVNNIQQTSLTPVSPNVHRRPNVHQRLNVHRSPNIHRTPTSSTASAIKQDNNHTQLATSMSSISIRNNNRIQPTSTSIVTTCYSTRTQPTSTSVVTTCYSTRTQPTSIATFRTRDDTHTQSTMTSEVGQYGLHLRSTFSININPNYCFNRNNSNHSSQTRYNSNAAN